MATKFLAALGLGFEILTDVNTIQPLHHEARFNEVKKDVEQLLTELQNVLLPNDKIAQAVVKAAIGGIDTVKFADIEPPVPVPTPAPVPPAHGGGA
jgi:hypothetical protein